MDFWTVSQVNAYIKNIVEKSEFTKKITIKGEISNFTNHLKTGHFYFTLKDSKASIKAIMFSSFAKKVPFKVESGMSVIVTGSIKVFERDGIFQIYCEKIEPDGVGAFYLAFEQCKAKLDKLGYFSPEHKKPIPKLPKKIAVVTSKTGDVLQDIRNILSRRYPLAKLILVPSLVQGENAVDSLCEGIKKAESAGDIDVIIIARGGGTIEDLWCFNSEILARQIYECTVPIISAVGHETDYTICDFVADKRGSTPSEAAELVAVDIIELKNYISKAQQRLKENINHLFLVKNNKLELSKVAILNQSPVRKLEREEQKHKYLHEKMDRLASQIYARKQQKYDVCENRLKLLSGQITKDKQSDLLKQMEKLEALSPLKVLIRGYSIAYKDENVVTSVKDFSEGDTIKTRFADGVLSSQVVSKEEF